MPPTTAPAQPSVLPLVIGVLVIGFLTVGVAGVNVWQLVRYTTLARQYGPGTGLAKAAWIVSVVAWFTGPLVILGAPVGIVLGAIQFRAGTKPADRTAGTMAVVNGVWILLAGAVLATLVLRLK